MQMVVGCVVILRNALNAQKICEVGRMMIIKYNANRWKYAVGQ